MSGTSRDDDAALLERIRRHLDEQADGLDGATLSRLAQARSRALEAASRAPRPWWHALWPGRTRGRDWLLPAGALASIVATAVALSLMVAEPGNGRAREVEDLELLTAGEEIELYENLEFYQWLQDRERSG